MLPNTLNTNEVKNSAGTEVEFTRIQQVDRGTVFAKIGESPALPVRLSIRHEETGSGLKRMRRSVARVDVTSVSDVDDVTPITTSVYKVSVSPIGASATNAVMADALAMLDSFCATLGTTTILLDGTGNGNAALLNGSL